MTACTTWMEQMALEHANTCTGRFMERHVDRGDLWGMVQKIMCKHLVPTWGGRIRLHIESSNGRVVSTSSNIAMFQMHEK